MVVLERRCMDNWIYYYRALSNLTCKQKTRTLLLYKNNAANDACRTLG
jgi:hypothetical protein